MTDKVSIITILNGEKEFIPLIKHNFNNFENNQDYELIIIDDGPENLIDQFIDVDNCIYIHLSEEEIKSFIDKIEEGYKETDKTLLYYQKKCNKLPIGFKRDYACGMTNHDYILHMNYDCIYNKKTIKHKLDFLKRVSAECIFCDKTLAYDIYGKELYKTQSDFKIYESTLFHTKEFWKRKGFIWSDVQYEGKAFHHNNGIDRKQDNYYDTVQLLTIHNMNHYKPVKITLENMNIDIPEIVSDINITEHPFKKYINSFYKETINILGLNSEFVEHVKDDRWKIKNITEKWKQPKLARLVQDYSIDFNVLLFNSKQPAWNLFNEVSFDIILLETNKNFDQMVSIIQNCKKYKYIWINGSFINTKFLENNL